MVEENGGVELFNDGGVDYELQLSKKPSEKNGGYVGVVKQGNLFHGKLTLSRGAGQTMLPGDGCKTAQEAALRIAKYRAEPYLIPTKNPERAAKGESKAKVRRLVRRTAPLLTPAFVLCFTEAQVWRGPRRDVRRPPDVGHGL